MTTNGGTVTLSDGRVLNINLALMSMREYRGLFDAAQDVSKDDAIYARVLGLPDAEALADLPQPDYRAAIRAVLLLAAAPLADPNSASASTSG